MKEQTLLEMRNQLATLGQVANQLIKEVDFLKTVAMGDHSLIKKLPGFQDALKELQVEHESELKIVKDE